MLSGQNDDANLLGNEPSTFMYAGKTLLDYALETASLSTIYTAWKETQNAKCLNAGDSEKIKDFFVENIADVNRYGEGTALHIAAAKGNVDIVRILMAASADLNIADENSMTALHFAVDAGHVDMIDFLLAKGASINIPNLNGRAPVQYAMFNGRIDIANRISETVFWNAYNAQYEKETFKKSNLPDDSTLDEIIYHAASANNRSRKVCVSLGWMDRNGKVIQDKDPRAEKKYDTEDQCLAAFLNLHHKKLQRTWLKHTELPRDAALGDVIDHARKNNNRSREVFMILGWMDKNGNMDDAPEPVKQIINAEMGFENFLM